MNEFDYEGWISGGTGAGVPKITIEESQITDIGMGYYDITLTEGQRETFIENGIIDVTVPYYSPYGEPQGNLQLAFNRMSMYIAQADMMAYAFSSHNVLTEYSSTTFDADFTIFGENLDIRVRLTIS